MVDSKLLSRLVRVSVFMPNAEVEPKPVKFKNLERVKRSGRLIYSIVT